MNLPRGYTQKDVDDQRVAQSAHAAGAHDAKAMTHTVCRATPAEWGHAAACYHAGWKIGKLQLQEQMDRNDIAYDTDAGIAVPESPAYQHKDEE